MSRHRILSLGARGDGVAEGPLFAARTLPGEEVSGTPEGARLTDIRILSPSPDRVRAPCRHFASCGGCQLQHASDAFVAAWKLERVRAALAARGVAAEVVPLHSSPPASRRRAVLSARRTKSGALAGFHARGSDQVIEVPECRLLHPRLMPALDAARDLARPGRAARARSP